MIPSKVRYFGVRASRKQQGFRSGVQLSCTDETRFWKRSQRVYIYAWPTCTSITCKPTLLELFALLAFAWITSISRITCITRTTCSTCMACIKCIRCIRCNLYYVYYVRVFLVPQLYDLIYSIFEEKNIAKGTTDPGIDSFNQLLWFGLVGLV